MRFTAAVARNLVIASVTASTLLVLPVSPASAQTPGTLIAATAQPDGWHQLSNGSLVEYWTTRSNGEQVKATGAMFVPSGPAPAGGWPIMAYDHGTSGLGSGCGGMADPQLAPFPEVLSLEETLLQYFVSKGFAVVAPDYLGLGRFDTGPHPYLETRTEATATLDLVRAARAANPSLSRSWAVTGTSQGGHAALGTSNLQVIAAPDLDFRGTIAIDPASDLEKILPIAGPWGPNIPGKAGDGVNGLVVSVLTGLRAARPDAQVDSYLTERGRHMLDSVGSTCLPQTIKLMQDDSIGDLLSRPLSEGPLPAVLRDYMTVPTKDYNAPILLLLNATDTTVPSPLHAALAAQFAANGVDFSTVVGVGKHGEVDARMWDGIHAFTDRILAAPTQR
ncbi:lipase family protein [Nocardia sp. NBC_01503]|uniref:lipase family protein n=1 Tax=Nocardia sp. NBC_01503 TaxID=2975997 RepID=UPI002E7AC942|nr:lipase family protein [Nocardia sp. NBC_01503]WTL32153.1 lipase family protein [Nocardia sp. NBC_01503]